MGGKVPLDFVYRRLNPSFRGKQKVKLLSSRNCRRNHKLMTLVIFSNQAYVTYSGDTQLMISIVFFLLYYIQKQAMGADSTSLTALARSVYHFSGLRTSNFLMLLTSNPIFFLVWSPRPPLNGPHSFYGILFSKLLKLSHHCIFSPY